MLKKNGKATSQLVKEYNISRATVYKWIKECDNIFNREIIGHSVSENKDANLVKQDFMSSKITLSNIELFHTDRGRQLKKTVLKISADFILKKRIIQNCLIEYKCQTYLESS